MLEITIPGKPFAKQRARFGNGRAYTPRETISYERTVAEHAIAAGATATTDPVAIEIRAYFAPPKSWSKKRKAACIGTPHVQRPDLDNLEKAVLDGLNEVAFADDCQVAALHSRKWWAEEARTEIVVRTLS